MLFPRTRLVDTYIEKLDSQKPKITIFYGPKGSGKTTFLKLLENGGILDPKKTSYIRGDIKSHQSQINKPKTLVFDGELGTNISEIRAFIKPQVSVLHTIILMNNAPTGEIEKDILYYEIPFISFREFAEGHHHPVNIGEIMTNGEIGKPLLDLRDQYIHLGQFGENLTKGINTQNFFVSKIEEMKSEIFEKETEEFLEFIRTIAMNVGELFKEERIAKLTGISRRKVRKYAHILAKHHMIKAIGPYYRDTKTELSQHVKLYFQDLSYMESALSVGYYHGQMKQGVIENFVLLELQRKLKDSHTIYFYRKKSGAEIHFILEDNATKSLTPIEINLRSTLSISQALKTFDDNYHDSVDHYMLLNEQYAGQKLLNDRPVIILPHLAV